MTGRNNTPDGATNTRFTPEIATDVAIGLNAVLAAVDEETPVVLCVGADADIALPYGPFDPARHRTFEIGMREWVERQTAVSLGYIEQLYTFGDRGREAPTAALKGAGASARVISVGYLALAPAPAAIGADNAGWRNWYRFFPWEDWRSGEPSILKDAILPTLGEWCADAPERRGRIDRAFGLGDFGWEEERALERYELMYEAGLVVEAVRDRGCADEADAQNALGRPMISDHRRILATAIGRLRGKLKYRPIIFEMIRNEFTLLQLQRTVEAIVGFRFHKQNFRRSVEKSGFVIATGEMYSEAAGRPAALFRVNREALKDRAMGGLSVPRMRPPADRTGP